MFSLRGYHRTPRAVYRQGRWANPPLSAASVFFAVKEAVRAARAEHGLTGAPFSLESPATRTGSASPAETVH